jgi:thioredoxin 1|tara:strand:- start:185 stop:445 length:261 start_codon:yes stop_codon:yes gene_type:complete
MKDKGIIFFNAPWCEPCKVLKPVINQIEKEGVAVKSVNIDYDAELKERYSPQSIPTLVLTDMGGTEIKRTQAGGWTKEQVMNWFYA